MNCCSYNENLLPILWESKTKRGIETLGVSHFICTICMSNVCCDDSLDRLASYYSEGN